MINPEATVDFSGDYQSEEYFRYLLDNNLVGEKRVPVSIQIDKEENWVELQMEDIELLSRSHLFWLSFINFECLIILLKKPCVVFIGND